MSEESKAKEDVQPVTTTHRPPTKHSGRLAPADALVLFGATGDLARKMLYPALQQLARRDALPATVIGVAASDWSTDDLVDYARNAVEEHADGLDADAFERLARVLTYIPGDSATRRPTRHSRRSSREAIARCCTWRSLRVSSKPSSSTSPTSVSTSMVAS